MSGVCKKIIHLSYQNQTNNLKTKIMKASKKQTVKILGQTVTVGTKLHAKLVAQIKHFNDLSNYENN